jgi:molybdenum cofactor cytidylyltransferase
MPGDAVAGVLLAAGTSSRMGRNKLLLEWNGETMVRGCARRALAGGVSPLIVVLGPNAAAVRSALSDVPCHSVVNPEYESGMASSVRAGLAAVPEAAAAAVILLADMPHVTAEMVGQMIQRYHTTHAPLVISDYDGVSAPPILYARQLWAELAAANGEGRGRDIAARHRDESETMRWPASALADLDVPEDYARLTSDSLRPYEGL